MSYQHNCIMARSAQTETNALLIAQAAQAVDGVDVMDIFWIDTAELRGWRIYIKYASNIVSDQEINEAVLKAFK